MFINKKLIFKAFWNLKSNCNCLTFKKERDLVSKKNRKINECIFKIRPKK
ncbi:hypothetical protein LEP1GSC122_3173 [Leptospira kirschneri serovar Valbuzzi str. 200702274]|nr:hypothetical protein LEP1GSC122_3173 [Leptospira kirschneri serovar Valbuzzi str. 200702274]